MTPQDKIKQTIKLISEKSLTNIENLKSLDDKSKLNLVKDYLLGYEMTPVEANNKLGIDAYHHANFRELIPLRLALIVEDLINRM